MSGSWISPTLQRGENGAVTIMEPESLAGRTVVAVDAHACLARPERGSGDMACGLVRNHYGDCWECSLDVIVSSGPFAVVQL